MTHAELSGQCPDARERRPLRALGRKVGEVRGKVLEVRVDWRRRQSQITKDTGPRMQSSAFGLYLEGNEG